MRILPGVCSCGFLCKAAVCVVSGLFMQSRRSRAFRVFYAKPQIACFRAFHAKPQVACFRAFHTKLQVACFRTFHAKPQFAYFRAFASRANAVSGKCGFPSSPASRANVASGRARLCRNLTDTSFLSVPLRAHLSGDRSITINPVSAVHFWYFSSISGRNREAFYQKYFYGISVLADILGIKPYFHKKNTRNRYQINSSW